MWGHAIARFLSRAWWRCSGALATTFALTCFRCPRVLCLGALSDTTDVPYNGCLVRESGQTLQDRLLSCPRDVPHSVPVLRDSVVMLRLQGIRPCGRRPLIALSAWRSIQPGAARHRAEARDNMRLCMECNAMRLFFVARVACVDSRVTCAREQGVILALLALLSIHWRILANPPQETRSAEANGAQRRNMWFLKRVLLLHFLAAFPFSIIMKQRIRACGDAAYFGTDTDHS